MSSPKQTMAERILARISYGAVPMDGVYWLDPREARRAKVERSVELAQPAREQGSRARGQDNQSPGQDNESSVCGPTPA
jgi:hypothetical protein